MSVVINYIEVRNLGLDRASYSKLPTWSVWYFYRSNSSKCSSRRSRYTHHYWSAQVVLQRTTRATVYRLCIPVLCTN